MAEQSDRLTLTIDWPEITIDKLSRLSNLWADLIHDVTSDVAGRKGGVKWVIVSVTFGSPLELTSLPKITSRKISPVVIPTVSRSVIDGMERLLNGQDDRPRHFRDSALKKAQKLAREASADQDKRIYVSNGHDVQVAVGERIVRSVDALIGPTVESYGSVEGHLEGLFTHGAQRFLIYESLTNRQIRCEFGDRVPLAKILQSYGQRVAVTGRIKSRAKTGQRLVIYADDFKTFAPDSELPSTDRILKAWSQIE